MKTYTLSNLKNQTGKVVLDAVREPVSLTKHGEPALVLMSRQEYERAFAGHGRKAWSADGDMSDVDVARFLGAFEAPVDGE